MDPSTGRFVSVDPYAGDPQAPVSLHRYLYANMSPVSCSDPTGNMTIVQQMATVSIIGLLAIATIIHYEQTIDKAGFDLGIADVWNEVSAAMVNLTPVALLAKSVTSTDLIDFAVKLNERINELERIKKEWLRKRIPIAYLMSGPSLDNGAKSNNWINPLKIGPRTWYREGGPYNGRLWGRGIFNPNKLQNSYTEIIRFDNKLDKHDFPQYAQFNEVYHFHVGGIDQIHFIIGYN